MSTPESGGTATDAELLSEMMLMKILEAGSDAVTWLIFERRGSLQAKSSLADVGSGSGRRCLLRQTFAKWPSLPQMLQGRLNTGHHA